MVGVRWRGCPSRVGEEGQRATNPDHLPGAGVSPIANGKKMLSPKFQNGAKLCKKLPLKKVTRSHPQTQQTSTVNFPSAQSSKREGSQVAYGFSDLNLKGEDERPRARGGPLSEATAHAP